MYEAGPKKNCVTVWNVTEADGIEDCNKSRTGEENI